MSNKNTTLQYDLQRANNAGPAAEVGRPTPSARPWWSASGSAASAGSPRPRPYFSKASQGNERGAIGSKKPPAN